MLSSEDECRGSEQGEKRLKKSCGLRIILGGRTQENGGANPF